MNLFITLLENVNKSRTSANNVSLMIDPNGQSKKGGTRNVAITCTSLQRILLPLAGIVFLIDKCWASPWFVSGAGDLNSILGKDDIKFYTFGFSEHHEHISSLGALCKNTNLLYIVREHIA
jgi:hypothetical protein